MALAAIRFSILFCAALAPALAACGGTQNMAPFAGEAVTVQLSEQSGSGQSGTATLTPSGDRTIVTVELSNPPAEPQPSHIHDGTCENLGGVRYPLANLSGGTSETTVEVSLEELTAGTYAINVHESEAAVDVYVACGPIGGATPASDPEDGGYSDY